MSVQSEPEEAFAGQLRMLAAAAGHSRTLRGFEREHVFLPPRKWRFDFAWVPERIAVEVEGGIYIEGRHSRGASYERDLEKYNEAALAGWTVLRVSAHQVEDGRAVAWLERALGELPSRT